MHLFSIPHINDKHVKGTSFGDTVTLLPVMNKNSSQFFLRANINYFIGKQTKIEIFSSGCINQVFINYQKVTFDEKSCGLFRAVIIDLGFALQEGNNILEITASQPKLLPAIFASPLLHVAFITSDNLVLEITKNIVLICLCVLIILLMHCLTAEYVSGILLSIAFLTFFHWFTYTNFMQYTMDMPGHLQYISYIAEYGHLPPKQDGWAFYHAPLYYVLQALVLRVGNYFGSFDPIEMLRIINIFYFLTFLIFGILTLHLLIKNHWAYYSALALLIFYPSGILFSSQIDSHLLLYPLYAGTIYFLLRWIYEERSVLLAFSLIFLGLCIATRTNGFILFPIFIIVLIYKWRLLYYKLKYFTQPCIILGISVVIIGLLINQERLYNNYYINDKMPEIVGNIEKLSSALKVENNIKNLMYFDIKTYLSEPFWSVWDNKHGRQYFWNSMLKSSLFGEFQFRSSTTAQIISLLLLWIIIYQIFNTLINWKHYFISREWWICILLLFIPISALIYTKWRFPYSCTQDFRYIYPALIAFCGLIGITIERSIYKRQYLIPIITSSFIVLFSYHSVKFFLIQSAQ